MVILREYTTDDTEAVGLLIKNTYTEYNLDFLRPEQIPPYLGPFAHAGDMDPVHQAEIHRVILSKYVFVAEEQGVIAGVLRGRLERLGSLFVRRDYHQRGIGRRLVEHFEEAVIKEGGSVIRVASSLYAVPFYLKMGYKRSTGVRKSWSFNGYGLPIQPMRKVLIHN